MGQCATEWSVYFSRFPADLLECQRVLKTMMRILCLQQSDSLFMYSFGMQGFTLFEHFFSTWYFLHNIRHILRQMLWACHDKPKNWQQTAANIKPDTFFETKRSLYALMKFRYHFYNFFTIDYRYKVSFYTQYVTYKRNSGCLFFFLFIFFKLLA